MPDKQCRMPLILECKKEATGIAVLPKHTVYVTGIALPWLARNYLPKKQD
jgi:hypothetical protein